MASIPPSSSAHESSNAASARTDTSTLGAGNPRLYHGFEGDPAAQVPTIDSQAFPISGVLGDLTMGFSLLSNLICGFDGQKERGAFLPLVTMEEAKHLTANCEIARQPRSHMDGPNSEWQGHAFAEIRAAIFSLGEAAAYKRVDESLGRVKWFWERGVENIVAATRRIAARGNAVL